MLFRSEPAPSFPAIEDDASGFFLSLSLVRHIGEAVGSRVADGFAVKVAQEVEGESRDPAALIGQIMSIKKGTGTMAGPPTRSSLW